MEATNNKSYQFQVSFQKKSIDEFLTGLQQEAASHLAVNHPYLSSLAQAECYDHEQALKDYTLQYQYYQQHSVSFLSTVISKLERVAHRNVLIQKLIQKSGYISESDHQTLLKYGIELPWVQGIAHTELYSRFKTALGVHGVTLKTEDILDVTCWSETFSSVLTNATAAEAIGAISFGTENIISQEYQHILTALIRYGKIARKDSVYFDLQTLLNESQQKSYYTIAGYYAQTEQGQYQLQKGMRKALNLRVSFWDAMYRKNIFYTEQSQCA